MHETTRRLYEAAEKEKGVTGPSAVAKLLGESPQTIKNWESRGVSKSGILTACEKIGCNAKWLEKGEGMMTSIGFPIQAVDDANPPADAVQIRRVKFSVSAGISGQAIDQEEVMGNPIFFRRDWLTSKGFFADKLLAVDVHGESMEPGLYDGDTVIVNTGDVSPKDGCVFVFRYEDETVVKRMIRDAGKWWLSSDNADQRRFPRKEALEGICEIIGRVIHKQSDRI